MVKKRVCTACGEEKTMRHYSPSKYKCKKCMIAVNRRDYLKRKAWKQKEQMIEEMLKDEINIKDLLCESNI